MSGDIKEKLRVKHSIDNAIAESLDNKASYKTILSSIKSNKSKGRSLYNYVSYSIRARYTPGFNRAETDFLIPSQPRNMFTEEFDGGLNSGFFEESLKSVNPRMINCPQHFDRQDPIGDLMQKNYEWIKRWKNFKLSYAGKKKSNAFQWLDEDVLYCPKYYIEMAAHLENKPDPYFHDLFNWYYSGKGNLIVTNIDGTDYIIRSEFNCLKVSPFFKDTTSIHEEHTASFEISPDTNICETVYSNNIIALRTRCKITILKLSVENMTLDLLTELETDLPYTSISFDEFHKNILYVTTIDYKLSIINIDRLKSRSIKLRGKFSTLEDNWNSVIGSERGNFLHITKKALTLYDKRTNKPYQRYKSIEFLSDVRACARITAAKYCQNKPLLYLGTNHELFFMDMRCGSTKENNMKPVQRWTHGMLSPPVYIDICNYTDNKEAVCLSSQWFEDMCVTTNHSDRLTRVGEIQGLCIPYRPPSIMHTLNNAQRKCLCCGYGMLKRRLCTFISGAQIIKRDDAYSVLMQNSLGDISCHSFYEPRMLLYLDDDAVERLHDWSEGFEKRPMPLFETTKIVNVTPLLTKLKEVPDDFLLGRNATMSQRYKFNEEEIREVYENEKLDPEFLEVWKDAEPEITLAGAEENPFLVDMS